MHPLWQVPRVLGGAAAATVPVCHSATTKTTAHLGLLWLHPTAVHKGIGGGVRHRSCPHLDGYALGPAHCVHDGQAHVGPAQLRSVMGKLREQNDGGAT